MIKAYIDEQISGLQKKQDEISEKLKYTLLSIEKNKNELDLLLKDEEPNLNIFSPRSARNVSKQKMEHMNEAICDLTAQKETLKEEKEKIQEKIDELEETKMEMTTNRSTISAKQVIEKLDLFSDLLYSDRKRCKEEIHKFKKELLKKGDSKDTL